MKRIVLLLCIALILTGCLGGGKKPTATLIPTYTPYPTYTPLPSATFTATPLPPTDTPMPTYTPYPTYTPLVTDTPEPTATETPQPTATPAPTKASAALRGRLAYTENKGNFQYDIYLINLDGTGKQLLVADASEPSFTKDGQEVMFYSWSGNGVDIMRLDGSNRRRVINDGEAGFANIGPDGYSVIYQTGVINWQRMQWALEIHIIGLDGQGEHKVTEGDQPVWHPTEMKFVCKTCDGSKCGLFVMNSDGSGRHMVSNYADDQNPTWSPDGRQIAFASHRDGNWEIYVMNADGSNQRRLTNNPTTDALPLWLPDGQHIAFRSDRGGVWAIYVMRKDGTDVRKIVDARCNPDRWRWERMAVLPQ